MEQQLMIPPSLMGQIPPMVKSELAKLSPQKQSEFLHEFERKAKSTGLAYLCLILFGIHYAYLGRWGIQIIFWITCGGFLLWWLIDLFRVGGLIRDKNQDIAVDAMRNLKSIM
jgi:TM2 domain-containing membrane protein YozV